MVKPVIGPPIERKIQRNPGNFIIQANGYPGSNSGTSFIKEELRPEPKIPFEPCCILNEPMVFIKCSQRYGTVIKQEVGFPGTVGTKEMFKRNTRSGTTGTKINYETHGILITRGIDIPAILCLSLYIVRESKHT